MATHEKKPNPAAGPAGSTLPPGWPNMPARSSEHEPKDPRGSAQVTDAQRELEREVKTGK